MNLGKTETRNIETESAIVNDHPASISAVEQMAKGHLYTYFLLTWRSTDGKRLRKHYPTLNKARHALSNLLKKTQSNLNDKRYSGTGAASSSSTVFAARLTSRLE